MDRYQLVVRPSRDEAAVPCGPKLDRNERESDPIWSLHSPMLFVKGGDWKAGTIYTIIILKYCGVSLS